MSQDPLAMPTMRHLVQQPPLIYIDAPSGVLPPASEEQARAIEGVFAEPQEEQRPIVDAINLAVAGMLMHDIVKDTLASSKDEEEDEEPKLKPKKDEPE